MGKKMIAGVLMAVGMLSIGTVSSFAAGPCCGDGKCYDKQAVLQFEQETRPLLSAIKAKDIELRELNGYDTFDIQKAQLLENDLRELKSKVNAAAEKHGISACCRS